MNAESIQIEPIRVVEFISPFSMAHLAKGINMKVETGKQGTAVTVETVEAKNKLLQLFRDAGFTILDDSDKKGA